MARDLGQMRGRGLLKLCIRLFGLGQLPYFQHATSVLPSLDKAGKRTVLRQYNETLHLRHTLESTLGIWHVHLCLGHILLRISLLAHGVHLW